MDKAKAGGVAAYALRLEAKRPGTPFPVLEMMQGDPSNKLAFLPPEKLTQKRIATFFPGINLLAQNALSLFSEESLRVRREELAKKHRVSKSRQSLSEYTTQGLLHHFHQAFRMLCEHAGQLRILHTVKTEGNRVRMQSCSLSSDIPKLSFRVERGEQGLCLEGWLQLPDGPVPLRSFNRAHFLLERANRYHVLSAGDYKILLWLEQLCVEQYAHDAVAFASQVLDPLDAWCPVDRNGCFDEQVIDCEPDHRVYLSELNGRYLVFTPAWNYEGFELEGVWKPEERRKSQGKEWLIRRKRVSEEAFVARLRSLHPRFEAQLNGYFYLSFEEAQKKQWFLNAFYRLLEEEVAVLGLSMLHHFRCSEHKPLTETELLSAPEDAQMRLRFSLRFGTETVALNALQKAIFSGQKIVLLRDGSMGVLPSDWFDTWSTLIRHAKIDRDVLVLPRWLALTGSAGSAEATLLKPVINPGWWTKWQHWQQRDDAVFLLPGLLRAQLRSYQQKGFEWLCLLQEAGAAACLADDMGLGKTLQTIAFLCRQLELEPDAQHLIVCPASLVYNWKQEWDKFAPSVEVGIYRPDAASATPPQVLLVTYHLARNHTHLLADRSFATIVLDESHQIKNPSAQITRAVCSLQGRFRVALSGTPVMNNTFDLYAQLHFLLPGLFGSREFFRQQYADAIDRNGDAEKIAALRRLTAPFLLRRTKEQVAPDLPARTEQVLWCTMGADQRMAYDGIRERIRSNVLLELEEKGVEQGKMSVLAGITRLKQLCCSAALVRDEDVFTTDSVKVQVLLDELQVLVEGHKVLVFSQFTSMLDLLQEELRKARIPLLRLDGATPAVQRQERCNRFNDAEAPERVFLISLKAGNAGLNLTAADYVFLFDSWWNASVEQQAIDRTHRIGQTRPVFAYRMICKDTIEEKILQLQQRKQQLSSELIQAEEGFVKSLTLEDIKFLLG